MLGLCRATVEVKGNSVFRISEGTFLGCYSAGAYNQAPRTHELIQFQLNQGIKRVFGNELELKGVPADRLRALKCALVSGRVVRTHKEKFDPNSPACRANYGANLQGWGDPVMMHICENIIDCIDTLHFS